MKTPLTYYGGKRQLAATILRLVLKQGAYVEPFSGSAAIYFVKKPARREVINDTNGEPVNFYGVLKRDFPALRNGIETSLHSRETRRQAEAVYANTGMVGRVKRARAVWMLANMSCGARFDGAGKYDRKGKTSARLRRKREGFVADYAIRMQNTQIECCDALRIIRSRDTPETFFYCDPPYAGSDQGHYDGYTCMTGIRGRILIGVEDAGRYTRHVLAQFLLQPSPDRVY